MITADNLRQILRHRCEEAGSQRSWCALHGLGETYVSAVLAGRLTPGSRLVRALGYQKKVVFTALQQTDNVK